RRRLRAKGSSLEHVHLTHNDVCGNCAIVIASTPSILPYGYLLYRAPAFAGHPDIAWRRWWHELRRLVGWHQCNDCIVFILRKSAGPFNESHCYAGNDIKVKVVGHRVKICRDRKGD